MPASLDEKILVPFCVESLLSGIQRQVKPSQKLVYRKLIEIPEDWRNKRLRLNFEAVDYTTTVMVNKVKVGCHSGGYDAFIFDITEAVGDDSTVEITVIVTDPGNDHI